MAGRGRLRGRQGRDAEQPGPGSSDPSVPPSLAAAVALVVAALAAVGVSGDHLARAARNDPGGFAWLMTAALAAVGVPTVLLMVRQRRWSVAAAVAVLVVVAGVAVHLGAGSMSVREQPRLAVEASSTANGTSITIQASASGLRSDEDMLVRARGVQILPEPTFRRSEVCLEPADDDVLLLWQQAGPDLQGNSATESTVEVRPGEFEAVCVYAGLRTSEGRRADAGDARYVVALLRTTELDFPQESVEPAPVGSSPTG